MNLDTARKITAERLARWADLGHAKPVTPAALVWLDSTPGEVSFLISCTEDLADYDLADLLEGLARRIRFQARDAARRSHA